MASSEPVSPPWTPLGILTLILALGLSGLLGQWTGLTAPAASTLTLLLLAATLWITEVIPLYVTSLIIVLWAQIHLTPALVAAGHPVGAGRYTAPFFSNIILLFLGGFALSAAFRRYLLDEGLARWVLRHTGDRPGAVLAGVMAVTAVLSMWMSNTATAAMMVSLAVPLLAGVGESDPYRKALVLGIAFAANLGGMATPIGTPPNAIALERMKLLGTAPGFADWMLMAAPLLVLSLSGTWLLLMRLYPAETASVPPPEGKGAFEWTLRSRLVVGLTLITALAWLTDGVHPLATGTVALVPVVVLFGGGFLDRADFRGLPWDVLMLAGGGLSLGAAVEDSGLGAAAVALLPTEGLTVIAAAALLALLAGGMTSVMSNTATANLLVPVVVGLTALPVSPLLMTIAFACSTVMVLPVSTPPNAIAFSSGVLNTADLVRPGLVISAVGLALTCTVGVWWWSVLGVG